jgi:hypothetical protein
MVRAGKERRASRCQMACYGGGAGGSRARPFDPTSRGTGPQPGAPLNLGEEARRPGGAPTPGPGAAGLARLGRPGPRQSSGARTAHGAPSTETRDGSALPLPTSTVTSTRGHPRSRASSSVRATSLPRQPGLGRRELHHRVGRRAVDDRAVHRHALAFRGRQSPTRDRVRRPARAGRRTITASVVLTSKRSARDGSAPCATRSSASTTVRAPNSGRAAAASAARRAGGDSSVPARPDRP